jgi:hypothetical protein
MEKNMKRQVRNLPYYHHVVELNENEVRIMVEHFSISTMEFDTATITGFEWIIRDGQLYGARLTVNPGGWE